MKVVSLIEPWGTLIKTGIKKIETRSWKTTYRGPIYIHTSLKTISKKDEHKNALLKLIPYEKIKYGYIIAKANLVDCILMDEEFIKNIKKNKNEYLTGEYSIGRYAWILENITPLEKPIKAKGHLGIWNYGNK